MDNIFSATKFTNICFVIIAFCLFFLPFQNSLAAAGCCSRHGGVAQCDAATGHMACKDGSQSPSCMCDGSKTSKETKTESKKAAEKKATKSESTKTKEEKKTKSESKSAKTKEPKSESTKTKESKKKESKSSKKKDSKQTTH